jgi:NitT/TauT family transport system permease protein
MRVPSAIRRAIFPTYQKIINFFLTIISPVVTILVWEIAVELNILDDRFFPRPAELFDLLIKMTLSGEILYHVKSSLVRVVIGFTLGTLSGVIVGSFMGLFKFLRITFNSLISILYPIPKVAILPLLMLIFGLGDTSKQIAIAIAVFFPVVINTVMGIVTIEKIYLDVGYTFQASRFNMFKTVALPGAMPSIMAGIRLGWGVALLVLVSAEYIGTENGLGYLIWNSWTTFTIPKMYVGLITLAFWGWLSFAVLDRVEQYLIPWKFN